MFSDAWQAIGIVKEEDAEGVRHMAEFFIELGCSITEPVVLVCETVLLQT
jgi:hypothetical protein